MSREKHAKKIASAVFPGLQWWPHENLIAAKAIAFGEALDPSFKSYCKQVVANAQVLWECLEKSGFKIVSWGTDNHLLLIDVFSTFNVTGKDAEKALEKVGLSVNKNMIPYDTRSPMNPSGIRIGTPAATTRGMWEKEMREIAEIFTTALKNYSDDTVLKEQKTRVEELCKKFPIYK